MKLYIDGDACPVKKIAVEIAEKWQVPVVIVTTMDHFSEKNHFPYAKTHYVEAGHDSADYFIVGKLQAGDLLITQDYGLASLALAKAADVLHHTGWEYTHQNIQSLLATRHLNAQLRKSGKRHKGPKAFTKEDQQKFAQELTKKLKSVSSLEQ